MSIVKYKHHGVNVSVREDLKGKHREHCLCWICLEIKSKLELPSFMNVISKVQEASPQDT